MTCKKITENLLWEYIDGELSPEQKVELLQHFEHCPPCKEEFEILTAFDQEIAQAVWKQPSLRFTKNVMEQIEIELSTLEYRPLLRKFWRRLVASGFGTAFAAFFLVAFTFPSAELPFAGQVQNTINQYTFIFQNTTIILLVLSVIAFWGLFLFDKFLISKSR